jgi:ATP-dependent DNA helicase RecG
VLDDAALSVLLNDLESDRVERKSSFSNNKDDVRKAVCAFANDLPDYRQPGIVFIGLQDDGKCANLRITDELLRQLADTRENLQPFPMLLVQKRVLNGCEVAVIVVYPSDAPPVRYEGRVWVRVGPRRAIATPQEERNLAEKRRAKNLPFDIWPVPNATLSDLDLDFFRRIYLPSAISQDVLAENQRSIEEQLASVRFLNVDRPTVLGILTTGKDILGFVPSAYIQFIRFAGTELTDPVTDQQTISGNLLDILKQIDDKMQAHVNVSLDITTGLAERRKPDYPITALRQLIVNAIMHRIYEATNAPVKVYWFNDRIEIQNPGGPFGQVTRENFGRPGITDYRNPHIADVLKNLGLVQRFGIGIATARRELEKNSNPPLEFQLEENYVLAIVRRLE